MSTATCVAQRDVGASPLRFAKLCPTRNNVILISGAQARVPGRQAHSLLTTESRALMRVERAAPWLPTRTTPSGTPWSRISGQKERRRAFLRHLFSTPLGAFFRKG
ncbi:hypothetical protein SVAN01_02705 [Stagonosporopsis vannaccii]|nr:hypothetical protein SVAN01_02705 [Stagonosporopsis vannaccii]